MKVKVAKWGNSLGVRLPKAATEAVGAAEGSEYELTVEGRVLKLVPRAPTPGEYLPELLAMIDKMRALGIECESETIDWGPDRGSEIIDDAYSRGEITLEDILKSKPDVESSATRESDGKDARTRRR